MNIVYLIGNGFDINLGLKTKYSDFYQQYTQIQEEDSENLKWFKEQILKDQENWADAEIAFGKCTSLFLDKGMNADDFFECYDDFVLKLADYLKKQTIKPASINKELGIKFAQSILIEKMLSNLSEVQREKIREDMNYFGGGLLYHFIDFNYTNPLDQCISATESNKVDFGSRGAYRNDIMPCVHVHGDTKKSMVLGVNDTEQISAPDLFAEYGEEYIGQMIKIRTNEMYEENTDKKVSDIINAGDLFYIYGMSIGLTDKIWWNRIIKRLLAVPNVHVVIHSFSAPKSTLLPRKRQTWVKRTKEKFLSMYEGDINESVKKALYHRIHIDNKNLSQN